MGNRFVPFILSSVAGYGWPLTITASLPSYLTSRRTSPSRARTSRPSHLAPTSSTRTTSPPAHLPRTTRRTSPRPPARHYPRRAHRLSPSFSSLPSPLASSLALRHSHHPCPCRSPLSYLVPHYVGRLTSSPASPPRTSAPRRSPHHRRLCPRTIASTFRAIRCLDPHSIDAPKKVKKVTSKDARKAKKERMARKKLGLPSEDEAEY